jgi:nucleotide-binding universal stress UspA family protein
MAYTIVVGFDGSEHSRKALDAAIEWAPDRPDVTIVNVARESGARLIVVGTKGAGYREGQRSALGSTTTKVLHEAAGIPVLVV